jgi:zinc transport system substrate-binding protein
MSVTKIIKFILITLGLTLPTSIHATPNIVVSIKPIHSLTAFICQGITTPTLLITGKDSPHTQSLTPNQLQAIQQADLVIWIGESYESHWAQPINKQVSPEKVLTLIQAKGLTLYPYRQQCLLLSSHDQRLHHPPDHFTDGHIWLDLHNARVIAQAIAHRLMDIDPCNKEKYQANLDQLLKDLVTLESDLKQQVSVIIKKTYIVYHDGLQYFDKFFGFQMAASLVVEPDSPPNAQDHLVLKDWLSKTPASQRPVCIFTEPAFQDGLSRSLAEEFQLKHQALDYLGTDLSEGPQAYFSMMRQLITDFINGIS